MAHELSFFGVAVVVFEEDARPFADALEFAPLQAEGVGLIDVEIVLLPATEVHGEEGLCVEFCEAIAPAEDADFGSCFEVDWLFWEGLISIEDVSDAGVEAYEAAELIGGEEIDALVAQVSAVEAGMFEEEFIAEVGG